METSFNEFGVCPICYELCDEPHELSCCHNICCEACIRSIQRKTNCCPICRAESFETKLNVPVQRFVNSKSWKCPKCEASMEYGQRKKHDCPHADWTCPICKKIAKNSAKKAHLIENHSEDLITAFEKGQALPKEEREKSNKGPSPAASTILQGDLDPTSFKKNSRGFPSKLGSNGKHYCGKTMDFPNRFTDGFCGVSSFEFF